MIMVVCSSCGINIKDGSFCSRCSRKPNFLVDKVKTKKASYFWFLLPIFLGIIGGGGAYYWLRKSDPQKAKICLIIGLVMTTLFFLPSVWNSDFETKDNADTKRTSQINDIKSEQEKIEKELELQQRVELQKQIDLQRQEELREEELVKQEELKIQQMKQLPESCYGVNSIETNLYPTGEECLELLDERIFDFCLAENNDDETKAMTCFVKAYSAIDDNCRDSDNQGMLSISYEVCFMSEMVYLYQEIPELINQISKP